MSHPLYLVLALPLLLPLASQGQTVSKAAPAPAIKAGAQTVLKPTRVPGQARTKASVLAKTPAPTAASAPEPNAPDPAISTLLIYSGRVLNSSLRPLSGAIVLVKGTAIASTTNAEGAFLLRVPAGPQVLLVDYPGHLAVQLPILRPDSVLTIKLFSTQPRATRRRP